MRRYALGTVLAVAMAGCGGGPPDLPRTPKPSSLAVDGAAVGVPYDRWIAARVDGRPLAFELHAETPGGNRVRWHWQWLEPPPEGPPAASGTTVERHGLGTVRIGDRSLEWSRGSNSFGWVYWPAGNAEVELYSRPFDDLEATREPSGGGWLRRSMFDDE